MIFVVRKDVNGEWRWRLRVGNNKNVAVSGEGYKNKSDCLHAIQIVKGAESARVLSV
ncbi:YegP family protein [Trichocoleus desertorum]|uniref:YegP family protein n=1 Tax=Trichocoleus desertorum TaxID=1481672 RepID=UPI00329941BC